MAGSKRSGGGHSASASSASASGAAARAAAQSPRAPLLIAAATVLLAALVASQWHVITRVLEGTPLGNALHLHSPSVPPPPLPVSLLPSPPHWGTYRPNLYLGVRGLWGESPLFGWAWSCASATPPAADGGVQHQQQHQQACDPQSQIHSLRHDAEERDGVSKYGWLQHDGDSFGVQGILDRKMGVNFTTSFIQPVGGKGKRGKGKGKGKGGKGGKDRWVMRIEATAVGATEAEDAAAITAAAAGHKTISLFFYTALSSSAHSVLLDHPPTSSSDAVDPSFVITQRIRAGKEAPELIMQSGVVHSTPSSTATGKKPATASLSGPNGVRASFVGLHIDESVPPPLPKRNQPSSSPPPQQQQQQQQQQFAWAAKDHLQRVLLQEGFRPRWNQFSARVAKLQREHQEAAASSTKTSGSRPPRPFVPPPPPHFVPQLPNRMEARSNFLALQYVINLPCTMDFAMQPTGEQEQEQEQEEEEDEEDEEQEQEDRSMETNRNVDAFAVLKEEIGTTERWFGSSLSAALSKRSAEFEQRFNRVFPLSAATAAASVDPAAPDAAAAAAAASTAAARRELSQALLSNLLGGIGYFFGKQLVEVSPERREARTGQLIAPARVVEESVPRALLSCVPSRSFFPRGFLWDEGFHQLLVSRWDLALSLHILGSWFSQIDLLSQPVGGWIPREQIRGEEARRRVPSAFQAQKPQVANPPTMMLALESILNRLKKEEKEATSAVMHSGGSNNSEAARERQRQSSSDLRLFTSFLVQWLPALHVHVGWFFRTQASSASWDDAVGAKGVGTIDLATGRLPQGTIPQPAAAAAPAEDSTDSSTEVDSDSSSSSNAHSAALPVAFRWAGRTKDHCLASGLDDYPRAKWLPTLQDKLPPSAAAAAVTVASLRKKNAALSAGRASSARSSGEFAAEFLPRVGAEGHVDLHAWMILLADTMAGLMEYAQAHAAATNTHAETAETAAAAAAAATAAPVAATEGTAAGDASASPTSSASINYSAVAASYRAYSSVLRRSLLALHWDSAASPPSFFDWSYRNGTRHFHRHAGYVSLLPLFLGVLRTEHHAAQILSLLRSLRDDRWALLSVGGLRSLSRSDAQFASGEDYWKGHVWINMQYIAVAALSKLAALTETDRQSSNDTSTASAAAAAALSEESESVREIRSLASSLALDLRERVSANVLSEYRRSGFVWEQYHAMDGRGRKSHPFTGWTALTLLLMTDE